MSEAPLHPGGNAGVPGRHGRSTAECWYLQRSRWPFRREGEAETRLRQRDFLRCSLKSRLDTGGGAGVPGRHGRSKAEC